MHEHKYTTLIVKRITRITNELYNGTAGDKAFLLNVCQCKAYKAQDYGPYKSMQAIKERQSNDNALTSG